MDIPFGDPKTAALLGLAQGLLAAGAPQRFPVGIGGALAQGIGGALSGAMGAQQYKAMELANAAAQGKADYYAGGGPTSGSQPNAAAGATSPVISNPGANYAYGVPFSGAEAQPQPQVTPSGFPLIPGLNERDSRAAALGWLAPGYVNAVASANAPTEFQKMQRAAANGDPVAKAWLEKNTYIPPVVNRGFGIGKVGPNGEYIPDQASEAQIARMEATKAGLETVPVTNAAGATVPQFKYTLPGFPGITHLGAAPAAPAAPAPAEAPATQAPTGPWASIPKLVTPQGLGQSTYQKNIAEGKAKAAAELTTQYGTEAKEADQRIAFNNQALELVDRADTGPGSSFLTDIKNVMVSRFGVPEKDFENTPAANTALNKDLVNSALQRGRQLFGSRFTQSEVGIMLNKAAPSAEQTKTAIKFLLQTDNAQLNYQKQRADDLGKYLGMGGDPQRFEAWYAKSFPLTNAVEQVHLSSGKQQPSYSQADLEYTAKKYNISVEEVKRRLGRK